MSKKTELLETRARVHAEASALMAKTQTAETRSQVKRMLADVDAITEDIRNIEQADKIAQSLHQRQGVSYSATEQRTEDKTEAAEYRSAYMDWLRCGTAESRGKINNGASAASLAKLEAEKRSRPVEQRDQTAGSQSIVYTEGNLGGYFVPAGFVYDIDQATKFFCPLLDGTSVRVMETATGNVLPYPTSNDTNEAWTLLGENTQVVDNSNVPNYPSQANPPAANPGNVLAGSVSFGAYKGSTGLIRVSLELMQDSAFSLEAFIKEAFAVRLGRGYEYYLTQGLGVNAPSGILPQVLGSGATPATAAGSFADDAISGNNGTNSIGWADLVNTEHSVDPTYRRGAKWMFHDQTLAHLKTRLDKFGRPFYVPSPKGTTDDTILGYPFVINQCIPQIGVSSTPVFFGQWSKFIVRKVRDLSIARLDERFADYGQVAYVGFSRIDSKLVDAGTHPISWLQMAS